MDFPIIDLQSSIIHIFEFLCGILFIVSIWTIKRLSTRLKLESDSVIRQYLLTAIQNSIYFGKAKAIEELNNADWTKAEVREVIVANAISYVFTRVPDAINKFKLTEQDVKELIVGQLGGHLWS